METHNLQVLLYICIQCIGMCKFAGKAVDALLALLHQLHYRVDLRRLHSWRFLTLMGVF